jgi:hypothetical protein
MERTRRMIVNSECIIRKKTMLTCFKAGYYLSIGLSTLRS